MQTVNRFRQTKICLFVLFCLLSAQASNLDADDALTLYMSIKNSLNKPLTKPHIYHSQGLSQDCFERINPTDTQYFVSGATSSSSIATKTAGVLTLLLGDRSSPTSEAYLAVYWAIDLEEENTLRFHFTDSPADEVLFVYMSNVLNSDVHSVTPEIGWDNWRSNSFGISINSFINANGFDTILEPSVISIEITRETTQFDSTLNYVIVPTLNSALTIEAYDSVIKQWFPNKAIWQHWQIIHSFDNYYYILSRDSIHNTEGVYLYASFSDVSSLGDITLSSFESDDDNLLWRITMEDDYYLINAFNADLYWDTANSSLQSTVVALRPKSSPFDSNFNQLFSISSETTTSIEVQFTRSTYSLQNLNFNTQFLDTETQLIHTSSLNTTVANNFFGQHFIIIPVQQNSRTFYLLSNKKYGNVISASSASSLTLTAPSKSTDGAPFTKQLWIIETSRLSQNSLSALTIRSAFYDASYIGSSVSGTVNLFPENATFVENAILWNVIQISTDLSDLPPLGMIGYAIVRRSDSTSLVLDQGDLWNNVRLQTASVSTTQIFKLVPSYCLSSPSSIAYQLVGFTTNTTLSIVDNTVQFVDDLQIISDTQLWQIASSTDYPNAFTLKSCSTTLTNTFLQSPSLANQSYALTNTSNSLATVHFLHFLSNIQAANLSTNTQILNHAFYTVQSQNTSCFMDFKGLNVNFGSAITSIITDQQFQLIPVYTGDTANPLAYRISQKTLGTTIELTFSNSKYWVSNILTQRYISDSLAMNQLWLINKESTDSITGSSLYSMITWNAKQRINIITNQTYFNATQLSTDNLFLLKKVEPRPATDFSIYNIIIRQWQYPTMVLDVLDGSLKQKVYSASSNSQNFNLIRTTCDNGISAYQIQTKGSVNVKYLQYSSDLLTVTTTATNSPQSDLQKWIITAEPDTLYTYYTIKCCKNSTYRLYRPSTGNSDDSFAIGTGQFGIGSGDRALLYLQLTRK